MVGQRHRQGTDITTAFCERLVFSGQGGHILWPFSKKLSINSKDILIKNNSDFVNLNVMYAYRILCQASVCNIQAACYILALLETII